MSPTHAFHRTLRGISRDLQSEGIKISRAPARHRFGSTVGRIWDVAEFSR